MSFTIDSRLLLSKDLLRIELDKEHYRGEEKISGKILVTPTENIYCRGHLVSLLWQNREDGHNCDQTEVEEVIFVRQWREGCPETYSFEWNLPNGTETFEGSLFNIEWYISAQAEVDKLFKPATKKNFFVTRGENFLDDPLITPNFPEAEKFFTLWRRSLFLAFFYCAIWIVALFGRRIKLAALAFSP